VSEEISSSQFLFWDPHHISVTNGATKLKIGRLVGISVHFLRWDPPHISETNGSRKLKFGMLVGICRYYGYMYKFVR